MSRRAALACAPLILATMAASSAWAAPPPRPAESTHVLVVASNRSLDKDVKPLRFADDDGARYWEFFSGWATRVSLLTVLDPQTARIHPRAARAARVPWRRNLKAEVARIRAEVQRANRAGRSTRFMFIYIGHGNVDRHGEGYINLQDHRLRRSELFREVIDQVPATVIHLVIDACKSFFLVSRGPGDWQDDRAGRSYGAEIRAFLARDTLRSHPHVGAILSTSGDEEVHEWSALRAGVFSHQLRSALSGAADINGDGRVEYSEVGAFIAAANHRVTHQRARVRPFVRPPPADRRAPLVRLDRASGRVTLRLTQQDRGRFSVEDERGVRHADLHKAADGTLGIALASAHQYFIRHGDLEAVLPRGGRGVVELGSLDRGPARSEPRGALDATYRKNLFALPLSRSYYLGFLATSDLPAVSFTARAPATRTRRLGLELDLSYGAAGVVMEHLHDGVQHNLSVGLKKALGEIWQVGAELGLSGGDRGDISSSLYRLGLGAEGGLRLPLHARFTLGIEAALAYQAYILSERVASTGQQEHSSDTGGLRFGSRVSLTITPFATLARLGILLHGGYFAHLHRVTGSTRISALPEGGMGVVYGF